MVNQSLPESYRQPLSMRHSRGFSPTTSLNSISFGERSSPTSAAAAAVARGDLQRINRLQSAPLPEDGSADGVIVNGVAAEDKAAAQAAAVGAGGDSGGGLQRSGTLNRQVPAKRLLLSTLSMPTQRGSQVPGSPRRGKRLDARSSKSSSEARLAAASLTGRSSTGPPPSSGSIGLHSSPSIAEEEEEGFDGEAGLSAEQTRALEDLMRLKQLVQKAVAKMDASRTEALLHAAAEDDVDTVQTLLQQGMKVDTRDYDGRTPIMIAAANGKKVS